MNMHHLQSVQTIKAPIGEVWDYFSSPKNLNDLTPPDLRFEILTDPIGRMFPGQILEYRIRLIPGICWHWVTEITHVEERVAFVDEQRFGPYKFWHHRHSFEEVPEGVRMKDDIHYALGWGWAGDVAHVVYVQRMLNYIFEYRKERVNDKFG